MTGSSQASALVSGIAALLLQLEPDLTPDQLKCQLISSAEPAINRDGLLSYSPFEQGYGLVSVTRAITLGEKYCDSSQINLQRDLSGEEHFHGPAIIDVHGTPSLPGFNRMVSGEKSANGLSKTRKWGVKAHIERSDSVMSSSELSVTSPFNWSEIYTREKSAIENLSKRPPQ